MQASNHLSDFAREILADEELAQQAAHDVLSAGLTGTVSSVVRQRLDDLRSRYHQSADDNQFAPETAVLSGGGDDAAQREESNGQLAAGIADGVG